MELNNVERVKKLYDKGFRCIRYEDGQQGNLTAYFKNFEEEKIDTIITHNNEEISQIKNFIDNNRLQ